MSDKSRTDSTLPPGSTFAYEYTAKGIEGKVQKVAELADQLERVSGLVDEVNGKEIKIEWEVGKK